MSQTQLYSIMFFDKLMQSNLLIEDIVCNHGTILINNYLSKS